MSCRLLRSAAIFVLFFALPCIAEIIAAKNPKAYTGRDYARDEFEFNRRTMSVAYLMAGKTDPAWDEAAVKYLDAFALRFTNAGEDRFILPGAPSEQELLRMGKQLIEAGCDDPLVLYCYAVGVDDSGDKANGKPLVQQALIGLQDSGYPPYRVASAARRMLNHLNSQNEKQQYAECEKIILKYTAEMASDEACKGFGRRMTLQCMLNNVEHSFELQTKLYEAIAAQQDAEPWVAASFSGNYHVNAAWESRGGGWARDVTPEGWKGFEKHLGEARECLVKAWTLEPTLPEAPTRMITVTMGRHGVPGENERTWFDRAVAAQLDYFPAYEALKNAYMPRWGGSHAKMLAFGRECVATGRHDTDVPWQYIIWVEWINSERENMDLWSSPAVYKQLKEICEGLDAQEDFNDTYSNSFHAAAAWHAGEYETAGKLVERLGENLHPAALGRLHVQPEVLRGHLAALKSPAAANVSDAQTNWKRGNMEAALKSYRAAGETPNLDPAVSEFIQFQVMQLEMLVPFYRGDWVIIQPDASLKGWRVYCGKWMVDDQGGLIGNSDPSHENGMRILCLPHFGRRFELAGTVELLGADNLENLNGGPIVAHENIWQSYGMYLQKHHQQTWMRCGYNHAQRNPAAIGDVNQFSVTVWDSRVSGSVNGQPSLADYYMRHGIGRNGDALIGVGAWYNQQGGKARFSNLKIRMLTDEP